MEKGTCSQVAVKFFHMVSDVFEAHRNKYHVRSWR